MRNSKIVFIISILFIFLFQHNIYAKKIDIDKKLRNNEEIKLKKINIKNWQVWCFPVVNNKELNKGQLIQQITVNNKGKIIKTEDDLSYYGDKLKGIISIYEWQYDTNENKVMNYTYEYRNYVLNRKTCAKLKYDLKNRLIEQNDIDEVNKETTTTKYTYDDKDNLIKEDRLNISCELGDSNTETNWIETLEYDINNNLIKKIGNVERKRKITNKLEIEILEPQKINTHEAYVDSITTYNYDSLENLINTTSFKFNENKETEETETICYNYFDNKINKITKTNEQYKDKTNTTKEKEYDTNENLIEEKEYNEKKLEKKSIYKYDTNELLIELLEYNSNNKLSNKQVYYYNTNEVNFNDIISKNSILNDINATEPISVVLSNKDFHKANYLAGDAGDCISIHLKITNHYKKDIRAFIGDITFFDLFDREINNLGFTIEKKIKSGESIIWKGTVTYNQFKDDFRRLKDISLEDIKTKYKIEQVIFTDGEKIK